MKVCEILTMEDFEKGQIVAGRIYLQDGELVADAKAGNEQLLEGILDDLAEEEPEKAFAKLPERYSGWVVRARFVENAKDEWDPNSSEVVDGTAEEPRREWHGLPVNIETKAGETRSGTDAGGKSWSIKMSHDYGELKGTNSVDGDPIDIFLGPDADAEFVYVVHTMAPPDFEDFDEDKCFLNFPSEAAARKAFYDNYTQPEFFGSLERFPIDKFIEKVKSTAKKGKPISIVVDGTAEWPEWIGVDLDGTLALLVENYQPLAIGPPNPSMVERVKKALQQNKAVKVFTARLAVEEPLRSQIQEAIASWTLAHVGVKLDSTNEKDPGMVELWDDRAKPIV